MITVDQRAPIWVHQLVSQLNQALMQGQFNDVNVSGVLKLSGGTLLQTTASLTNGAGASAGTLANAPAAGNPTKWIPISDNGSIRFIPAW